MSGATPLAVYPAPRIGTLLARRAAAEPLAQHFQGLFFSCTEAVYWACRGVLPQLKAAGHPARIYVPAYHCGVEVEAALRAGYEVRFVRTGLDCALDEEHLATLLAEAPGAVLPIHYYGWAQPGTARIAELCREYNVPLIADCAHAWWTDFVGDDGVRKHVGDLSTVAVYSLRKWIGLYDGGALCVAPEAHARAATMHVELPQALRHHRRPYVMFGKDVVRRAMGAGLTDALRRARYHEQAATCDADDDGTAHPSLGLIGVFGRQMTALSIRLAQAVEPHWAAQRRRDHYRHLTRALEGVEGFAPLFAQLDAGACPLAMPLRVDRRAELQRKLCAAGIEPFIFGEVPHPALPAADYPVAATLRDTILCVPLHQDLTHEDLERIVAALTRLLPEHVLHTHPTMKDALR